MPARFRAKYLVPVVPLFFILGLVLSKPLTAYATIRGLPDTGQTTCYDSTLVISCGGTDHPDQDGDYTTNAPSYTAGTYSTTDNNTGLVWQKYGHGSSDGYTVPSSSGNCASGGTYLSSWCKYNWQDSLKYCSNLSLDGQTDWRLPNAIELASIVNYSTSYPSIDTSSFLYTGSSIYWSSTTDLTSNSSAFIVPFYIGGVSNGTAKSTNQYYVRCVRGSSGGSLSDTGQTDCYDGTTTHACGYSEYPDQDGDYTINSPSYTAGTYSTTDNNTGLIWQKHGHGSSDGYSVPSAVGNCASGGTYSSSYCTYAWQDALKYCSNLSLDGQTDWRLPNAKELASIVKFTGTAPFIDTTGFLNTKSDSYWSSTTKDRSGTPPDDAWQLYFMTGSLSDALKTSSHHVRCVRGAAGTALPDTGQTSCYKSIYDVSCGGTSNPDQDADYTINDLNYGSSGNPFHQISGNTTFYNLVATETPQTVTFVHDSITAIADNGTLTLNGAAGILLTLQSDGNIEWYLRVSPVGTTVNVSYVQVSQSNAGGYKQINASNGTNVDLGHNINWLFNPSTIIATSFQGVTMQGVDVNQQEALRHFPDSGQTTCYDGTTNITCGGTDYPLQDADLLSNAPAYTVSGNSVTDTNTGKIYQKDGRGHANGFGAPASDADCYNAIAGSYDGAGYCKYSWQDALKYCAELNLDGYTDWRLPDAVELASIVKYGVWTPSIDTGSFSNTKSSHYWSSTTAAISPTDALYVYFDNGNVYNDTKVTSFYVRCVRGE